MANTKHKYGHIRRLAEVYRLVSAPDINDIVRVRRILHSTIIESLPGRYLVSYNSFNHDTTSRQLADKEEISIQQASSILADMCEWGLLDRREAEDYMGTQFYYVKVQL